MAGVPILLEKFARNSWECYRNPMPALRRGSKLLAGVGCWIGSGIGEEDAGHDNVFLDRHRADRDFALRFGGVARAVAIDEQAAEGFGAPELETI
jgi:hypothetical protein